MAAELVRLFDVLCDLRSWSRKGVVVDGVASGGGGMKIDRGFIIVRLFGHVHAIAQWLNGWRSGDFVLVGGELAVEIRQPPNRPASKHGVMVRVQVLGFGVRASVWDAGHRIHGV